MQYDNNFGSKDLTYDNSSAFSQDRNTSLQNTTPMVNISSFTQDLNNTDQLNTGGRKPTADSTAYPVYKSNGGKNSVRGKFSTGGGSIDGANPQVGFKGDSGGNTYNTGPNTTASRFYNPNKHASP